MRIDTPDDARELMHRWTESEALRVHMECVAACVAAYARRLAPEQTDRWTIAGILHDFDYEKHPSAEEHPFVGVEHLRSIGVDDEITGAILAHADYTGAPRDTPLARVLFACDELAGFIVAVAKVRPNGLDDLKAKSVTKKLKDRAFAAAVSRDDIDQGAQDIQALTGDDRATHIQTCIDAIHAQAPRLGL